MEVHGNPLISMEIHELRWISIEIYAFVLISFEFCIKNTIIPAFADKSEGPHTPKIHKKHTKNVRKFENLPKTKIGQNRPQVGAMKKRI